MKKIYLYGILILVLVVIALNYGKLDNFVIKQLSENENYETGVVERIVDGDTIKINNESVRLLGINCPEKGEKYYSEAKEFLGKEILNESVEIHFGEDKYDLYGRKLGYIFYKNQNINSLVVKNGFANPYFPSGKNSYYPEFFSSWNECLENELNLCEKSQDKCSECIILKEWGTKNQLVILKNTCDFSCDLTGWTIKDEGRKKFVFEKTILEKNSIIEISAQDFNETYVWTSSGDTIYIRDNQGKLVLWENY
ncbi:MAG: thermonuclease family protein [Candidatus Pacearchaeota archaeon]|jgi:micrococcal nuclease